MKQFPAIIAYIWDRYGQLTVEFSPDVFEELRAADQADACLLLPCSRAYVGFLHRLSGFCIYDLSCPLARLAHSSPLNLGNLVRPTSR
jgi:hypothetical protein